MNKLATKAKDKHVAHSHSHPHATHPAIVKRLNRATGHLRSIVEMIEGGRPCTDIAMQLHAVERAITSAKRTLIQDHLSHCLTGDVAHAEQAMAEFQAISKYL